MKAMLSMFVIAVLIAAAPAEKTCSIFGVVEDKYTGSPLPYANIVVVGTTMGAMTLTDGSYCITGVPPGIMARYSVTVPLSSA